MTDTANQAMESMRQQLRQRQCRHTDSALDEPSIAKLLAAVPDWQRDGPRIVRRFQFDNYYQTLAFVNALAWIVHAEDHHPELTVTYNTCTVRFDTHSVNGGKGGLSENDFICAAKIDLLPRTSMTPAA